MTDFLFECFAEEVPARMQEGAAQQLHTRIEAALKAARLDFITIETFVSPRHLAARVTGLPDAQPDQTIERKGPKTSAPQAAIDGFLKSTGLSLEQLEKRIIGKDETYFAITHEKGLPTAAALQSICEQILHDFHWPKSMRWGAHSISWVRPLQNILCLFGTTVVPVQFGHLTANNITYGHRFLAPQAITITSPADYEKQLREAQVIVNRTERADTIRELATPLLEHHNLQVTDWSLLDEVVGLVEWPTCLIGEFEPHYLTLPPEVLVSEMRHHQKYFALAKKDDTLSNRFLVVANMRNADGGKAVINGNARVLRARLADGEFYWNQDRNRPLSSWANDLSGVVFHARLGTIKEKTDRIAALSTLLAVFVPHADLIKTERAAQLAKADLVTGMVGEFPDLQGIMGRYYALEQNEDPEIAEAILEHYLPTGAHSPLPTTPLGITLAITDRLDSLVGLFAIGDKPTGSKDPYALRRAALGIIRIILEHKLRMPLRVLFDKAAAQYAKKIFTTSKDETVDALLHFFAERLKAMLKDQGIRHDIINAVFNEGAEDDLLKITAKARALAAFLATDDGANLLAAYRRASNILTAEEKKDNIRYDDAPKEALFELEAEKTLHKQLETIYKPVKSALDAEDYATAMHQLASLRPHVDAYFEAVMVNADDADIRRNRLYTLNLIRTRMDDVAGFTCIEG